MNKLIYLIFFTFSAYSTDFDGYIIKFKNNKSAKVLKSRLGGEVLDLNLSFGSYSLWKPTSKSIIKSLENDPNVEYIEPNYLLKNIGISTERPSDESFGNQWALSNPNGIDINAEKAWKITKGSKNIVIGILDSGITYDHPDLVENMWINEEEANGIEGFDDDNNGYIDDIHGFVNPQNQILLPIDRFGHGTHVAGIIGMAHNGIGGRGVMGEVKLMPLRAENDQIYTIEKYDDSNYTFPLAITLKAIDYAINKKVNIITVSMGGLPHSNAYEELIRSAIDMGITVVVSAGNSNFDLDKRNVYPAAFAKTIKELIVVGNHDQKGKKFNQSSFGKNTVAIFAPGASIYSTYISNDGGPSYESLFGTSMATPFVTGAIGLLLSIEPDLTPAQVKERLIRTAKKEKNLKKYTISGGRLDLVRLLKNIEN